MTCRYMLDTDTASYVIRKRSPSVEQRLRQVLKTQACISMVTRAEIMFGLNKVPRESEIHQRASDFFNVFGSLIWDVSAAEKYAELRFMLERRGTPIGVHDTMIAAHAMSLGAVLITNNVRHFERVGPELKIENWHQD